MPHATNLRLRVSRVVPIAATAATLVLAGPAVGSASAKVKHAPCPTAGKTLAKASGPNVRVWRQGTTLLACTRQTGKRRVVRTLGVWTTGTKVAVADGTVAYTTTGQSDEHGLTDAVDVVDVPSGKRWFSSPHAALVPDTAEPETDDRVLRIVVGYTGAAWVTSRGIVNLAVRRFEAKDEFVDTDLPFHVGSRFFLGDAGVSGAAGVAKGVRLVTGGESDDCGGTTTYGIAVPAIGTAAPRTFTYGSAPTPIDHEGCGA
jgi:hypothetical protein